MNIDEIREEIAFRMDVDRDARFDPLNALSRTRHASVAERNGWQGVTIEGAGTPCVAVPPVYDSVRIVDAGSCLVAEVSICDRHGAWIIDDNPREVVPCEYDGVETDPLWGGLLFRAGECEGLYGIPMKREIFACRYAEVSLNAMTRFIWARKPGGTFITFDSETGDINTLPGATRVFETDGGVLYADQDNYVHLVNAAGLPDPLGFRRMVIASSGRLRLRNSRVPTESVCDASGYIINL